MSAEATDLRPPSPGDQSWFDRAACAGLDTDWFFPDRGESTRQCKAICRRCPVRVECLQFALEANELMGIWGGMAGRQRIRLRRQLRLGVSLEALLAEIDGEPEEEDAEELVEVAVRVEAYEDAELGQVRPVVDKPGPEEETVELKIATAPAPATNGSTHLKTCDECGRSYTPFMAAQRFCSARCRTAVGNRKATEKRRAVEKATADQAAPRPTRDVVTELLEEVYPEPEEAPPALDQPRQGDELRLALDLIGVLLAASPPADPVHALAGRLALLVLGDWIPR